MRQGIFADLSEPIQTVYRAGLLSKTCDIYEPPGATDAAGQWDMSNLVPVSGLQGIPCMLAVQVTQRPDDMGVARLTTNYDVRAEKHALLYGYYPAITQGYLAMIAGTLYQINAVEPDSQNNQTRMAVREYEL